MFEGFSPETMDFLWNLRFNNNREWFMEHKEQYVKTLYEPMKQLAKEVYAPFAAIPGMELHVSRIYKDMRMHPDVPYKDSLWFCIRRSGAGSWLEKPCLCFEVRPEGYRFGFILLWLKAPDAEALRKRIAAAPEKVLDMVSRAEERSGILLGGDEYVRAKPCPDERLLPFFKKKNYIALIEREPDDKLFSGELTAEVSNVLESWYEFSEFCQPE